MHNQPKNVIQGQELTEVANTEIQVKSIHYSTKSPLKKAL